MWDLLDDLAAVDFQPAASVACSAGTLGAERGLNTAQAFGHLGFTNVLCWADPARDIAAALLTTGKSVAPEGFLGMLAVSAMISAGVPAAISAGVPART